MYKQNFSSQQKKYSDGTATWFVPMIVLLGLVLIWNPLFNKIPAYLVNIYSQLNLSPSAKETSTGPIGDTFGGTIAPVIGLVSVYLTFLAFWMQYRANKIQIVLFNHQRDQLLVEEENRKNADIKDQEKQKKEKFESRFFQLLRLHKDNVDEIKITWDGGGSTEKRKAFAGMFNELKYTYCICYNTYLKLDKSGDITNIKNEQLIRLAYIFFYAGIGTNSDIANKYMTAEFPKELIDEIKIRLDAYKIDKDYPSTTDEDGNDVVLTIKYIPWGGHQSRLGHYYRHLFQTVKYVISQDENLVRNDEKREYLKTLRAQLSDYEQLMLYYNAIAGFGKAWMKDEKNNNINYFVEYHMIHNIPLPLANFGLKPEIKFANELIADPHLFEWLEG